MKKIILSLLAILAIVSLTACGNKKVETNPNVNNNIVQSTPDDQLSKSEQTGTAGSNIPTKDNYSEAEYKIKVAMQDLIKEVYGSKVSDARIFIQKVYSAEEEQEVPALKEMELKINEIAFEVKYDLNPVEGADVNELSVPNGEFDKESGWVINNSRVGILRPNGEGGYKITDFGTGW